MNATSHRPAIDLTRHNFMREWKDLVIFGTWVFNDDQEAEEPALVIVPRYRQRGFYPVVIALSAAYRYNSPNPRYLAYASKQYCKALGFEDSIANANKIAEAIHAHLLDLLKMPPSPTTSIVIGEANIDMGNGRKRKVELMDHEPTAQA